MRHRPPGRKQTVGREPGAIASASVISELPLDDAERPADPPLLVAQSIAKSYRRKPVLRDVTLEVRPGEAVGIVGENGVGKTTLAQIAAGLLAGDEGVVRAGGRIGYCPQRAGLLEHLTAEEHLVLFGRGAGLS